MGEFQDFGRLRENESSIAFSSQSSRSFETMADIIPEYRRREEIKDPGPLLPGEFEINGIRFPVPPQGINIYEENQNFKFETLRTQEATKIRSGHSKITITVTAIFTGNTTGSVLDAPVGDLAAINETLMPILYSLKKMPLCFLDNELLRASLPIVNDEIIGAFVRAVNVSTVQGMPYALSAEFQFVWYNHRVFTPRIRFRKEWEDDKQTGTVVKFMSLYRGANGSNMKGEQPLEDDTGRNYFLKNYGHPSVVFNATATHTWTENIHEARPLLEYLWPYKYKTTNYAVDVRNLGHESGEQLMGSWASRSLNLMPPFRLSSLDTEEDKVVLDFTIMKNPEMITTATGPKSILQIAQEIAGVKPETTSTAATGGMKQTIIAPLTTSVDFKSPFGATPLCVSSPLSLNRNGYPHNGVDLAALDGTPVFASADGEVRWVQDLFAWSKLDQFPKDKKGNIIKDKNGNARRNGKWAMGIAIEIAHPSRDNCQYTTRYMHMSQIDVAVGTLVKAGKTIGKSGYTAILGGPQEAHLHFEIRKGGPKGPPLDPLRVMRGYTIDQGYAASALAANAGVASPSNTDNSIAAIMDPLDALTVGMTTRGQLSDAQEAYDRETVVAASKAYMGPPEARIPRSEDITELEALTKAVEEGWVFAQHGITGKVAQIKHYLLDSSDFAAVPMAITAGFGTNLVMTPMEGHRFPTVQYIGGQHTSATVGLRVEAGAGREYVRALKDLQNAYEYSAINFREFSRRRGIEITNPLINAINMRNILVETIDVDTIVGAPESLSITISFIDNTINGDLRPLIMQNTETNYTDLGLKAFELILKKGWVELVQEVNREDRRGAKIRHAGLEFPDTELQDSYQTVTMDIKAVPVRSPHDAYIAAHLRNLASILTAQMTVETAEVIEDSALSEISERLKAPTDAEAFLKERKSNIPFSGTYRLGFLQTFFGTETFEGIYSGVDFAVWLSNSAPDIIELLGKSSKGRTALDADFAKLYAQIGSARKFEAGNQAYQDLMLPPNPISGLSVDTNPDFFLVNESDVHLCQNEALRIIFGSEGFARNPKVVGLSKGLDMIDNGHDNFKDIIGLGSGGGLNSANAGRGGVYLNDNEGKFRTSFKKRNSKKPAKGPDIPTDRTVLPERIALMGDAEFPIIMENDIARRIKNKKIKYDKAKVTKWQLDQSHYAKDQIDTFKATGTDALRNQIKVQHTFETNTYKENFTKFSEKYTSDHYAVRRSFPTFKIFFVEEDGGIDTDTPEGPTDAFMSRFQGANALDDFYGVNAVREISIVQNKDAATSTCVIDILDLDGVLFNRKYDAGNPTSQFKDLSGQITFNGGAAAEDRLRDDNNPFYSTIIKEGMKVLVKMGYMNDPASLETVFVGQIAQYEGMQVVRLVCQSYGSEMVSKKFGDDPSENANLWNADTSDLIHDMLDREELMHFGRWQLKDINPTGHIFGHEKLRPDGQTKFVRTWKPSVVDDNVFIPTVETMASTWARIWGDLEYVYWDTTIWDVLKEMELRHPGYVSYIVPYGGGADARMTYFFGHPDMEYIYRPPGDADESKAEYGGGTYDPLKLREALTKLGRTFQPTGARHPVGDQADDATALAYGMRQLSMYDGVSDTAQLIRLAEMSGMTSEEDKTVFVKWYPNAKKAWRRVQELAAAQEAEEALRAQQAGQTYTSPDIAHKFEKLGLDVVTKQTMVWQEDRLKSFRNYEVVTSLHDIIANNISLDHRDTFNSIELHYSDCDVNFGTFEQSAPESLVVNADDNIKEHHIRRNIEVWPNCTTTDLARRYASQLLANSLKRTYKGSLTILGRPKLKPYDILYIYDSYGDMAGPVEIEEVVHSFSQDTGFITEVVPNMIVVVREEVTMLMVDAISKFFTEQIKDYTVGAIAGLGVGTMFFSGAMAASASARIATLGESTAVKAAKALLKKVSLEERMAKISGQVFIPSDLEAIAAAKATVKAAGSATKEVAGKTWGIVGPTAGGITTTALAVQAEDGDGINRENVIGFVGGLATIVGFELFPIAVPIAAIIAGNCLYKYIKYNTTREPIIITPLIKEGKPYVTGIEGMETDGLVCTDLEGVAEKQGKKWRYYADGLSDAAEMVKFGISKWMQGS